jgi:excisionase family DNA binding protein
VISNDPTAADRAISPPDVPPPPAAAAEGVAGGYERLLTISEAALVLNVPENWLRKKVAAHAVPCTRIGKHVRFTRTHLDRIIESGEQPPIQVVAPSQGISRRARRAS